MKSIRKKILALTITLVGVSSHHATAGGLWLNEYGTPAMGRANAGAEAGEDNASASIGVNWYGSEEDTMFGMDDSELTYGVSFSAGF